jgi:AraC-like DNA-binding protein
LSLLISTISLITFYRIHKYINILKSDYKNQLTQIKNNISSIKISLTQSKLSDDIVDNILCKLREFENSKKFTNNNLNLKYLATDLKTNSKYLSRVINLHKKKSFTQYINDLRIEYLVTTLKTDKTFSNYTISAVAKEIGFKTANDFSRAFFKKTGKYPSDYIKELNK